MATDLVTAVHESMTTIVAPLREQLDVVESTITERETELAELRKVRSELRNALGLLDPEKRAEKAKAKASTNGGNPKTMASQEQVEELATWLQAQRFDEFSFTTLKRISADVPISQTRISSALHQLHEHGVIRIVRTTVGGGRVYRMV